FIHTSTRPQPHGLLLSFCLAVPPLFIQPTPSFSYTAVHALCMTLCGELKQLTRFQTAHTHTHTDTHTHTHTHTLAKEKDGGGGGGGAGGRRRGPLGKSKHPDKRSEEHTSELQSHLNLACRLL